MEQQVAEAAKAMVRSDTDRTTRAAASLFLEQFTATPEAWSVYSSWVRSFTVQTTPIEEAGMQLLCLQLLQGKIRKEVRWGTTVSNTNGGAVLHQIQTELGTYLQQGPGSSAAVTSASTCLVALAVRTGGLQQLVQSCQYTATLSPSTSLKLLAMIPLEMEACSDLRTPQVTAELWPFLETVLDFIRRSLTSGDATLSKTTLAALETLTTWASTCHITLTILSTPTCGGSESLLPVLIHLLSQHPNVEESLLVQASQALTEAILQPTDNCTETRTAACNTMFAAIQQGFVVNPLGQATKHEWEDACHALATLICTLVTEEVDELVSQPAEPLLVLLLQIQNHPYAKTRMAALDCWLVVQDIPTSQRCQNWNAPLFHQVVQGLLTTTAYPVHFTSWEQELELDESEFHEFRRMCYMDVYVSAYFLLRADFIQHMVSLIVSPSGSWAAQEAALFALTAVSREACARCKAQAGGTSISKDQDRTAEQLLVLVKHLIKTDPSTAKHRLMLEAIVHFIGAYAPAWATKCSSDAVLQLLGYLKVSLVAAPAAAEDTADAIRAILVGCSSVLLSNTTGFTQIPGALLQNQHGIVAAVLWIDKGDAIATVATGYTRLSSQTNNDGLKIQLLANLVAPILGRGHEVLNAIPAGDASLTPESILAIESLGRCLQALKEIVRFCDTEKDGAQAISDMMTALWPFLEDVSSRAAQYETVLGQVLAIHEQLLKSMPDLVAPHFQQTLKYVVKAFERTKHPSTLGYMKSAVEGFGSSNVDSFRDLIGHVATIVFTHISAQRRMDECTELIRAFFEMNQRYILYCPAALTSCPQLGSIVACSVESLTACQGERESTRACFNFLSQLFGWRSLRLSEENMNTLQSASQVIDEQVGQHGARVTQTCMTTLVGGAQMLWPSCTDCLFAVLSTTVSWSMPEDPDSSMAHQWMNHAKPESSQPEVYQQVVGILLRMARNGPKNKAKAKRLLTDYCKIYKGEMTPDVLVAYSLF